MYDQFGHSGANGYSSDFSGFSGFDGFSDGAGFSGVDFDLNDIFSSFSEVAVQEDVILEMVQ